MVMLLQVCKAYDPIDNNQLTKEDIKNCEKNSEKKLKLITSKVADNLPPRKKDTKYTPISLRQEKPYAILMAYEKLYPTELSSTQIAKLNRIYEKYS